MPTARPPAAPHRRARGHRALPPAPGRPGPAHQPARGAPAGRRSRRRTCARCGSHRRDRVIARGGIRHPPVNNRPCPFADIQRHVEGSGSTDVANRAHMSTSTVCTSRGQSNGAPPASYLQRASKQNRSTALDPSTPQTAAAPSPMPRSSAAHTTPDIAEQVGEHLIRKLGDDQRPQKRVVVAIKSCRRGEERGS
jgi:hypothetical protein